jgi:MoaA/NifB/PqqE/SkfB family radical SAM enzyme
MRMNFSQASLIAGAHEPEQDGEGPFVWTRQEFVLRPNRAAGFVRLRLCYLGSSGMLRLSSAGGILDEAELHFGWHDYVLALGESAGADVTAHVSPLIPAPGDTRELAVMLRDVALFDDRRLFDILSRAAANAIRNEAEYRSGATVLASYPPMLRVTLETRCNIPETGQACVYCAWNWAKSSERGSPAFRLDTLSELGAFYTDATAINDCSIGEPTMIKQFGPIVQAIDYDQKPFSFTTNGQTLGERRRRDVLGKNVTLYVSIDSATAAGYARFRNDRFDDIIANLRALCREKRAHGNRPTVFVSFIAMRSNVAELPEYFDLMASLGVDEVKLRTLYLDDNIDAPVTVNNGYRYDYAAEILSMAELTALSPIVLQLAAERRLPVYIEWDEFGRDEPQASCGSLCAEPWKTLYVLRRGIMPCCYATQPLARWDEQGDRTLEQFLKDVWNGPALQEIREELAAGRLAEYCLDTPSCPILKRHARDGITPGLAEPIFAPNQGNPPLLPMIPIETLTMLPRSRAA